MNRTLFIVAVLAAVGVVSWRYPMFHVLRRSEMETRKQAEVFDAAQFAEIFWEQRLTPKLADAAEAIAVLNALSDDAEAARKQFGRTVGLSRATYFLVRGRGKIVAVDKSRLGVSLAGNDDAVAPDVWLVTGPVFSNAVRDASGLLQSQSFINSQDFNALAAALNALVEQRVAAPLRKAANRGQSIEFAACVEVPGGKVRQPLALIPLDAKLE